MINLFPNYRPSCMLLNILNFKKKEIYRFFYCKLLFKRLWYVNCMLIQFWRKWLSVCWKCLINMAIIEPIAQCRLVTHGTHYKPSLIIPAPLLNTWRLHFFVPYQTDRWLKTRRSSLRYLNMMVLITQTKYARTIH